MTIFKFSEKITNGIKIRFKNLLWHPVVIITNTFYVDVRIWPHNRLKNHLVLDFVSAEQSLSENFTHFWPNFSLGPPVLQFLFQKSKKTTSNAAVPLRAWWWWEKSRQQWSALCKQQQWSITSAFFQYFLKLFSLSSFSGSQWLKIAQKGSFYNIASEASYVYYRNKLIWIFAPKVATIT